MKSILKDKRGVFGLTEVQSFFAVILGIAIAGLIFLIGSGSLWTYLGVIIFFIVAGGIILSKINKVKQ